MSELAVADLISVSEAIRIVDSARVSPRIERVSLAAAHGRRLAMGIIADRDDPPFDKSQMDGFAVSSPIADRLEIVGDIPAGVSGDRIIRAGQAMSVMTGAPIPDGTHAIVPIEKVDRQGNAIHLEAPVRPGQFIARRGSDCRAGDNLLRPGATLGPAQIAVAASAGAAEVEVFARPRVCVLSTGDEIVSLTTPPASHQIRNTNSPMLQALLQTLGCDVSDLGIVPDVPEQIRAALERGIATADALFVTGGMSMGTYDYVPQLLLEMGFELKISKLKIKPGKPFVFATREKQIVFGLPGNPVSGFVCTLRMASRLLVRMGGGVPEETWMLCKLASGLPENGPREFYQPAVIDRRGTIARSAQSEFPTVRPLAWKASSDIYTLASANALIVRGESEPAMAVGTMVNVLMLPTS